MDVNLDERPGKPSIGRIERGFNWLGYHLSPTGLHLADTTLYNFAQRLTRLYQQEAGVGPGAILTCPPRDLWPVGWSGWANWFTRAFSRNGEPGRNGHRRGVYPKVIPVAGGIVSVLLPPVAPTPFLVRGH